MNPREAWMHLLGRYGDGLVARGKTFVRDLECAGRDRRDEDVGQIAGALVQCGDLCGEVILAKLRKSFERVLTCTSASIDHAGRGGGGSQERRLRQTHPVVEAG